MTTARKPKASRKAPAPDTAARVLEAARAVLIEDGHAQLSARRVAARVGISVGNLTYHFPDKKSLVAALIDDLLAEYGAEIERQLSDVARGEEDRFGGLVAWLVRDAASASTMRTFRELWAMALHDKSVARAVDDFYDAVMARAIGLLAQIRPDLGEDEARRLILLGAMISEGSSVLFGTRRKRGATAAEMAAFAAGVMSRIAGPYRPK